MAQFAQNRYFPVCAFVLLNYPLFHPLIFLHSTGSVKSQFNYGFIKATRCLPMSRVHFLYYCHYAKSRLNRSYNMCHILYNYNNSSQPRYLHKNIQNNDLNRY
ncbi:Uncharacterised protein [Acinetobacter baumannii]|nr:Uncharacterised protein [Acinetobacter baumannii]